ncbi:MAG: TraR/DksA family transcriptional regulator [Candidatus Omnitrophica bacterium]|nr:TraR/DksA family transcriptional regulator [Candidatus Omnitrophota bacterium]
MTQTKMDKKKLDQYKKLLLKLKENFLYDITNIAQGSNGGADSESRDVSGHVQHMADVATDMYDREFNLGLASNEREILYKVDLALKKIKDKRYGICTECSKSITEARLKAIPYVETCLKCQEKIESQKK